MAKQLQFRRGTTAENDAFKGAPGEVTYDIERKELRIHDGVTLGGKPIEPSANIVHTIGNETIGGIKTFTSQTRKTTALERGVVPSTNTNVPATQFMDKNSKVLGELEYFYGTNGKNGMTLLLYDSSGNRGAGLRIGQNSDGTTYASAPTPASTSNSTDLATTAWVNNAAVHKTGNETIAGTKTFTSNIVYQRDIDQSVLPSNNQYIMWSSVKDKNYDLLSYIETSQYTTGDVAQAFGARRKDSNGTNHTASILIKVNADFTKTYRLDSNPTSSSNGTDIATTAWVRDLFETLYPVGSLYITSSNTTTCPLASIVKKSDGTNSTWSLVSSGKALWTGTGSNGNTTIAAGLPNITGTVSTIKQLNNNYILAEATGAFSNGGQGGENAGACRSTDGTNTDFFVKVNFNASNSSSVYGASTTVQPPAYVVNVWRRVS